MTDHDDLGARLARGLHEEAEGVRPDPALQSILARTRRTPARSSRSRWWPVAGAALATGGLVAVVAFVALDDDPTVEPPVASTTSVTVYFPNPDGKLVSASVEATDTGDQGLNAVKALLAATPEDPDYLNPWRGLSGDNAAELQPVSPVTVSSVRPNGNLITVDFHGPVDDPWPQADIGWAINPDIFSQQLVWTVQAALDSNARVEITRDGEPVDSVLTAEVRQPITMDPYAEAPIQIQSPTQGASQSSPVTVEGIGRGFEGTIQWRVLADGDVVEKGITSGGAMADLEPFSFDVNLQPGDYTVEAFEFSAENGKVINLDSKDFTVE